MSRYMVSFGMNTRRGAKSKYWFQNCTFDRNRCKRSFFGGTAPKKASTRKNAITFTSQSLHFLLMISAVLNACRDQP